MAEHKKNGRNEFYGCTDKRNVRHLYVMKNDGKGGYTQYPRILDLDYYGDKLSWVNWGRKCDDYMKVDDDTLEWIGGKNFGPTLPSACVERGSVNDFTALTCSPAAPKPSSDSPINSQGWYCWSLLHSIN